MRATTSVARLTIATMLLAGIGVASASSASAVDQGPLLPGNVFLLANNKDLATATAADQVTGATSYAGYPFTTVAVDAACPANTAQANVYVRLKNAAAEVNWDEVPLGGGVDGPPVDAKGRVYVNQRMGNFNLGQIQNFLAGSTKVLPLAVVCMDIDANPLGYFSTDISIAPTATPSWSQVTVPTLPDGGGAAATATTTTVAATAQGANLLLTATVDPAPTDGAGTVTFAEGSTTIDSATIAAGKASATVTAPTAGDHTYTATFTPSDTTKYLGSSGSTAVTITKAGDGSITVTLTTPPTGEVGSVTLSVPANAAVALAGQRDAANTRLTAAAALPAITVTDTHRSDRLTAWQVNVQASDFTSGSTTIGAKYLGLTPSTPSTVALSGSATIVQAGAAVASYMDSATSKGLSEAQSLGVVATKGQGTTTLGGQLNFAVPGPSVAQGTYTSVITVTLIGG
ncbi:MAG: Ig-like domain-containing protein [Actinobacteria bacterium]|nr:Ig-like domain-containing protein [Actinomycetota bacterium]MCG2801162.1 Ig-like domain-containing protein [Cellulomonas sp.]